MSEPAPPLSLDADRPDAAAPDLYNRHRFVQRLAQAVARRPSSAPFIIGIEGRWGEGKSTVLEYMARELEHKHPEVILVRFNPWAFPGQDQMLLGLVRAITEQFDEGETKSRVGATHPVYAGMDARPRTAAAGAGRPEQG